MTAIGGGSDTRSQTVLLFTANCSHSRPPATQCSDRLDNDGDGLIDLNDHPCRDETQDSEKHPNR